MNMNLCGFLLVSLRLVLYTHEHLSLLVQLQFLSRKLYLAVCADWYKPHRVFVCYCFHVLSFSSIQFKSIAPGSSSCPLIEISKLKTPQDCKESCDGQKSQQRCVWCGLLCNRMDFPTVFPIFQQIFAALVSSFATVRFFRGFLVRFLTVYSCFLFFLLWIINHQKHFIASMRP